MNSKNERRKCTLYFRFNDDIKLLSDVGTVDLISYCKTPRTRKIAKYLELNSVTYVINKYVYPRLIQEN